MFMGTMTKRIAVLVLFTAVALISAGAEGTKETAKGPVEIRAWMGSWWADQIPTVEQAFAAAYPNIRIKIEPVPISGYVDKAVAAVLGGSPPDVLDLDATFIPALVERNLLLDWSAYVDKLDSKDFAGAIWQAAQTGGKVYAVPNRASSVVFYYNKTMFDGAGVPYPTADWTYADMLAKAQKLTSGGAYGFGMAAASSDPANVVDQLGALLWAKGGDVMSADGKTIRLAEAVAVGAMQAWADLYTKYKVVPPGSINYSSNDQLQLLKANKVAMLTHADSAANELAKQTEVKWGIQLYPEKVNRGGGWAYTIPVGTKHEKEAREYILWFSKSENLAKYMIRMPARPSATTAAPWNNDIYKVFLESARYTRLMPTVPQWTDIQALWIREMQKVLEGKLTAQQAMENVKKEGEALLKK